MHRLVDYAWPVLYFWVVVNGFVLALTLFAAFFGMMGGPETAKEAFCAGPVRIEYVFPVRPMSCWIIENPLAWLFGVPE